MSNSALMNAAKPSSPPATGATPGARSLRCPSKKTYTCKGYLSTTRQLDADRSSATQQVNFDIIHDIQDFYVVESNGTQSCHTVEYDSPDSSAAATEDSPMHLSYPFGITRDLDLDTFAIGSWVDDASLMNHAWDQPPTSRNTNTRPCVLSIGSADFILTDGEKFMVKE
ncbi:hypothetical protein ONS95_014587 [Cadophora gregata]|uniref:uncharacterized protein n=1 Tax=Cadophora gregata TaxID=51156 RepID=UPI0026DB4B4B|nr:uncharacterized protein ONS95_014587 [Cadophora gregata]KAK0112863.1 hypothetical protein ONS95_014587 [Cadophora gregata]KAK0124991.1 hypothetical protein ONS96_008861 [Cadophora gregata f. sp. sojae]